MDLDIIFFDYDKSGSEPCRLEIRIAGKCKSKSFQNQCLYQFHISLSRSGDNRETQYFVKFKLLSFNQILFKFPFR